jgi:hypothetical protein
MPRFPQVLSHYELPRRRPPSYMDEILIYRSPDLVMVRYVLVAVLRFLYAT